MTTTTGGAMDLNRVEKSLEEFDALLDSSTLGAPRVRAVRSHTPEAMREELAARLSDRSAPVTDAAEVLRAQRAAGQAAPSAPAPDAVPRPVTPRSAPMGIDHGTWTARGPQSGIRSPHDVPRYRFLVLGLETFHARITDEFNWGTPFLPEGVSEKFGLNRQLCFVLRGGVQESRRMAAMSLLAGLVDSVRTDCEPFLTRLRRELTTMGWARGFGAVPFVCPVEPSKTGQPGTDRVGESSIGRFGMGVKLALACSGSLVGERPFGAHVTARSFLGSQPAATSLYIQGHYWSDPVGFLDGWLQRGGAYLWRLDGERAAYAGIAADWYGQTQRAQHWWYRLAGRFTPVGGHRTRDSVEPANRLTPGTNYVWCKSASSQTSDGNRYWLRTDLDTETVWHRQYVSAFALSPWGNDRAKDNRGYVIPDCWSGRGRTASMFLAAHEAWRTTAASRDRDHVTAHSIHPLAPTNQHGCLPEQTWWNDLRDAPDQRSAMALALACAGPLPNDCGPHHWLERLSKLLAGTRARPAYPSDTSVWDLVTIAWSTPLALPAPARTPHGQAAASLRVMREREPLAATGGTASPWLLAESSCHLETAQGVTMVRAASCLLLLAPPEPIPVPATFTYRSDDPYAVHAVFEQPAGHQVPWTFARDLLVEGMNGVAGSGDVQVWRADEPAGSQEGHWVNIALSVPQGEAVLQMRQADLRQFLDRTQALIGYGSEHSHMQVALDIAANELLHRATSAGTQGARILTGDPGEGFTVGERSEAVDDPRPPVVRERPHQGCCAELEQSVRSAEHEHHSGCDPL